MSSKYTENQLRFLKTMTKYIWWQTEEESLENISHVISQVLNIGTLEDLSMLFSLFSHKVLIETLANSKPGYFSQRSWNFWHVKLLRCDLKDIPPLPRRGFY
jgi:hypothetical protein